MPRSPVVAAALLAVLLSAAPAAAVDPPTWGSLSAEAPLGGPTTFTASMSLTGAGDPDRIEALVSSPGDRTVTVLDTEVGPTGFTFEAKLDGHILPNTRMDYRFRATYAGGVQFESETASVLVTDDRFTWKSKNGDVVRLHWYNGDDAFAARALDIGDKAVANAGHLLGVTEDEPIDFFIYADEQPFLDALGPGTRESVAGRAVAANRTMYGLILPSQVNDDWVDILVTHELTHLVFDTATKNDYHFAPHWLNEGVATYLSEGNAPRWQSSLRLGITTNSLIPLQGMGAGFGAGENRFDLGYAESVSAVDYFVKTYSEPKLWDLIRSYSEGLADDDAFTRSTGAGLAAFNQAWMKSISVDVPGEAGPRPGPSGPLPPDWRGLPPATPGAVVTPGALRPGNRPSAGSPSSGVMLLVLGASVTGVLTVIGVVAYRRRGRPSPPPTWPPAG